MKLVPIGGICFSKLICGSNQFYGHSHFSEARNAEYLARFNDETIMKTIQRSVDLGVNAVESCANERILSLLSAVRERSLKPILFVGSTRIDETSSIKSHQEKLALLIRDRAHVCVIHSQYVDRPVNSHSIGGLAGMIDKIHAAGLLAGISTHRVGTVELCEKNRYGIDTYMFPLNLSGFVYPGYDGAESVQERVDLVRGTAKPFILIKALGAGRIPPDEGLHFVVENSKPEDLISLGFGGEGEVAESVRLIDKYA
jgi:hypothetical protein